MRKKRLPKKKELIRIIDRYHAAYLLACLDPPEIRPTLDEVEFAINQIEGRPNRMPPSYHAVYILDEAAQMRFRMNEEVSE